MFGKTIDDEEALRRLYRQPSELVLRKSIDHVDAAARAFIEGSPFVVLATWAPTGCDASPRGGPPGFVKVLDDQRLAMADLSGNNRLDTYRNILDRPAIGMIFLVPGVDETLRVNGRAVLTTDPDVLAACAFGDVRPKLAVGVEVEECFIHCAKAFRRSQLWQPESWIAPEDRPSAACALVDHLQLGVDPQLVEDDLEAGYKATMWLPGGRD